MGIDHSLACIIMASGHAKRFGTNKLLYPIDGTPLCELVFSHHPAEFFKQTLVVTPYAAVALAASMHGLSIVENSDENDDIATTIRLGMEALAPNIEGCLFSVCDQPWLSRDTVAAVTAAFLKDKTRIVAASWQGKRGNPVLFPRSTFEELRTLPPQCSGGKVIEAHPDLLTLVNAVSARELIDIDTKQNVE
ncbi:MAG: nucleotidyltransferase family protein [Ruthenibacterium sp.]